MDSNVAMLLSLIPATLVVIAAVIVRNAGPKERAGGRLLLLLELITLVILILLTAIQFLPLAVQQPLYWVSSLFVPVVFGLVVLFLVYLPEIKQAQRRERYLILVLALVNGGMMIYHLLKDGYTVLFLLVPMVVFTLVIAWLIRGRTSRWVWFLPGVAFLVWLADYSRFGYHLRDLPQAIMVPLQIAMFIAQILTVATIGLFVQTGLGMLCTTAAGEDPKQASIRASRIEGALRLLVAGFLLAYIVYSAYWASIWDQTTDGLGGVAILSVTVLVAVASGMVMSLRTSGKSRLVGILFAVVVSILVQVGFRAGWDANFKTMTEDRAAQIAQALDRFHHRENRYPQNLSELAPRDLLYVPRPVMFQGEDWCYQGSANEYNLAAFFHEYFGLPVSLKVYASTGNLDGAGAGLPGPPGRHAGQARLDPQRRCAGGRAHPHAIRGPTRAAEDAR